MACKRWEISTIIVTAGTTATKVRTASIATTPDTTTTATTRTRNMGSLINRCVERIIQRRIQAACSSAASLARELVPDLFELVERAPCGVELLLGWRCVGSDLFLQLEHERQFRADFRRRFQKLCRSRPVDVSFIRRKVLVLFTVIVVNVRARDEFTQRFKTLRDAISFRTVGEIGVTSVEVDP